MTVPFTYFRHPILLNLVSLSLNLNFTCPIEDVRAKPTIKIS